MSERGTGDVSFLIAPSGQTRGQAPQSMHSIEITALPSMIRIASVGQLSVQAPHPVHSELVMT